MRESKAEKREARHGRRTDRQNEGPRPWCTNAGCGQWAPPTIIYCCQTWYTVQQFRTFDLSSLMRRVFYVLSEALNRWSCCLSKRLFDCCMYNHRFNTDVYRNYSPLSLITSNLELQPMRVSLRTCVECGGYAKCLWLYRQIDIIRRGHVHTHTLYVYIVLDIKLDCLDVQVKASNWKQTASN